MPLTRCKHPLGYVETCRACALEKEGKRLVELHEDHTCFIVRASTGIFYTNQTGGTMCAHPEMEGYIDWPEEYSELSRELNEWIYQRGGSSRRAGTWTMRDAWFPAPRPDLEAMHLANDGDINRLVALKLPLKLDEDALRTECWGEAWIPVILADGRRAILTYHNSD